MMNKKIHFYFGKICSGKSTIISKVEPKDKKLIIVSNIVKEIVNSDKRSDLQQTAHLDCEISKIIINKIINSNSNYIIVDGIRQKSIYINIIKGLIGCKILNFIVESDYKVRKERYNKKDRENKYNIDFNQAELNDQKLGIDEMIDYIKNNYDYTIIKN